MDRIPMALLFFREADMKLPFVGSTALVAGLLLGSVLGAADPKPPQIRVERCSSILVGRKATLDGSVLLAHNEDLANYCAHHYVYQPGAAHPAGAFATTVLGTKVPQVARTFAFSGTRIFDPAYVPGDITSGVNEHQVAVANNMSYRREAPEILPTEGRLVWTDFTRLALERARSAREAVAIIGELAQTYKLGADSGTMYAVADPSESWWVEVTLEGQWVAQRVPDDGAEVRANIFRIGVVDLQDPSRFLASPDLISYAKAKGWHAGVGPFDFARTYGAPAKLDDPYNTRRQWRAEALLKKDAPRIGHAAVMAILRDHYEGTDYDLTQGYRKGSPHQTDERTLCSSNTEVSVVCQLRSGLAADLGALAWRAMATPCSAAFTPWYFGSQSVPAAYRKGNSQATADSAYWVSREHARHLDVRYAGASARTRKAIAAFERQALAAQPEIERKAAQLLARDPAAARAYLDAVTTRLALKALQLQRALARP
jgi:dipeptidase